MYTRIYWLARERGRNQALALAALRWAPAAQRTRASLPPGDGCSDNGSAIVASSIDDLVMAASSMHALAAGAAADVPPAMVPTGQCPPTRGQPLLTGWVHGCSDPSCADASCMPPTNAPPPAVGSPEPEPAPAPEPAVCRHWWRKGACGYGESCKFGHPPHDSLPAWPSKRGWHGHKSRTAGRQVIDCLCLLQLGGPSAAAPTTHC